MENCKNSQEYKAGRAAAEWWQTLSEEQRKQMDIVDAFAYGVLHGWNNPNWISVEEELPKIIDWYLCYNSLEDGCEVLHWEGQGNVWMDNDWHYKDNEITHWMPLPPRKEDKQ